MPAAYNAKRRGCPVEQLFTDNGTDDPVSHAYSGNAKTLDFREKSFDRPIIVISKEGNFALLAGLLSSFLTIIIARLIGTKKRSETCPGRRCRNRSPIQRF